ncbi:hypothetical protein NM208_g233 [Fusarium decemcellulare]|uniref:Uncharacterized protein n=1 Tax=Fusarium decemcellulare TaxID=57161 RepID=A0ACC1T033_9HYPO|nr:hypothetical protein NM208_g233 [Fusarium decemcellulare]
MATIDADPIIAPDENIDDGDSSLGEEAVSSTESLRSSILDFRHENGRTYHRYKEGKYNLPNDNEENERLDLQHNLCLLTFDNKLGLSPPNLPDSKVKRALDLGTGTGIWAIDFGDEHPEADVVGVDLSPIQPGMVPPNVQFMVDDIDEEWTYSEPFDYIHSRMMNFSIQDWPIYLRKIYDNLTPGGYVELQEVDVIMGCDDGTLTEDTTLFKWCGLLDEVAVKLGRKFARTSTFKDTLAKAGFVDIVETRFKWPTNRWPKDPKYKELGAWNNENSNILLEALTLAPFTRGLGWSREEVEIFLVNLRKDFNDPKIHAYWPICSVYARKPET